MSFPQHTCLYLSRNPGTQVCSTIGFKEQGWKALLYWSSRMFTKGRLHFSLSSKLTVAVYIHLELKNINLVLNLLTYLSQKAFIHLWFLLKYNKIMWVKNIYTAILIFSKMSCSPQPGALDSQPHFNHSPSQN